MNFAQQFCGFSTELDAGMTWAEIPCEFGAVDRVTRDKEIKSQHLARRIAVAYHAGMVFQSQTTSIDKNPAISLESCPS